VADVLIDLLKILAGEEGNPDRKVWSYTPSLGHLPPFEWSVEYAPGGSLRQAFKGARDPRSWFAVASLGYDRGAVGEAVDALLEAIEPSQHIRERNSVPLREARIGYRAALLAWSSAPQTPSRADVLAAIGA
jgi:hypothetical protein